MKVTYAATHEETTELANLLKSSCKGKRIALRFTDSGVEADVTTGAQREQPSIAVDGSGWQLQAA